MSNILFFTIKNILNYFYVLMISNGGIFFIINDFFVGNLWLWYYIKVVVYFELEIKMFIYVWEN